MLSSGAALVAGYAVIAIVNGLLVPALELLVVAALGAPPAGGRPASVLFASLALSTAGAVAGGWVASRIAGRARLAHAVGLGAIGSILVGLAGGRGAGSLEPRWYLWALAASALLAPPLGGLLEARKRRDHRGSPLRAAP